MKDVDDFGDWVANTGPGLIRFGYLVCGDQQLAEDLAAKAVTRVRYRWRRLADGGNPDAYARAIVVSQLRSLPRRRARTAPSAGTDTAAPASGDDARDSMLLWSVILGLPERMRAAVVLRFYEDLDDDAIGQVLHWAPSTVPAHISEALDRLRSHPALSDVTIGSPAPSPGQRPDRAAS
jgi:DNA-directed RNA polymerase specialized sigma24 family protein